MFVKRSEDQYNLVFDYDNDLPLGEKIKTYEVYMDNNLISGVYDDRLDEYRNASGVYETTMVYEHEVYDKDNILVHVISGVPETLYSVKVDVVTNRNNTVSKSHDMYIDEDCAPIVYDDLYYAIQTDGKSAYFLPRLNEECEGFRANTEMSVFVNGYMSGVNLPASGVNYNSWFTSWYCPLFTTVTSVRMVGGPALDAFHDDTINRYIHKNSIEAIDMYNASHTCGSLTKCRSANGIPYDYFDCDHTCVPYAFQQYVTYKAAYDLNSLKELMNTSGGCRGGRSESNTLGDFSIKYGGATSSPSSGSGGSIDYKRIMYNEYMGFRRIIANMPKSSVKGWWDYTKGYKHPVQEPCHNRLKSPSHSFKGPWRPGGL